MQAIKKKNFNEAVVAQGLLEVATEEDGKCHGPIECKQWPKRELNQTRTKRNCWKAIPNMCHVTECERLVTVTRNTPRTGC